jgi:hypothetical protein
VCELAAVLVSLQKISQLLIGWDHRSSFLASSAISWSR